MSHVEEMLSLTRSKRPDLKKSWTSSCLQHLELCDNEDLGKLRMCDSHAAGGGIR